MIPAAAHRAGDIAGLVERYVHAGTSDNGRKCRRLAALRFTALFGDLARGQESSTAQRLQAPVVVRSFVAFAAVQARIAVDAQYVVRSASKWGAHQADLDPLAAAALRAEAISLGFIERESNKMWSKLSQIAVIVGSTAACSPQRTTAGRGTPSPTQSASAGAGCPSRPPPPFRSGRGAVPPRPSPSAAPSPSFVGHLHPRGRLERRRRSRAATHPDRPSLPCSTERQPARLGPPLSVTRSDPGRLRRRDVLRTVDKTCTRARERPVGGRRVVTAAVDWSMKLDVGMSFLEVYGPVPRIHAERVHPRRSSTSGSRCSTCCACPAPGPVPHPHLPVADAGCRSRPRMEGPPGCGRR